MYIHSLTVLSKTSVTCQTHNKYSLSYTVHFTVAANGGEFCNIIYCYSYLNLIFAYLIYLLLVYSIHYNIVFLHTTPAQAALSFALHHCHREH